MPKYLVNKIYIYVIFQSIETQFLHRKNGDLVNHKPQPMLEQARLFRSDTFI
jgi:hypothetical protein